MAFPVGHEALRLGCAERFLCCDAAPAPPAYAAEHTTMLLRQSVSTLMDQDFTVCIRP